MINMNRLMMRPRPLDINKKLKIVTSVKEFEDDELTTSSSRQCQILRPIVEAETKVHRAPGKKFATEIPTPKYVVVEAYERDYSQTFTLSVSYIRGRGARAEFGEFVEYDLDNEDEDWLQRFNQGDNILSPDKFETILFKLEVLDYKARERARVISQTPGSPIPVLLLLDSAAEVLKPLDVKYTVLMSVYDYWKKKRQRWRKPILRQLQPRPPAHDRNPNNVFRPRVKIHRPHTRRIQRHENNVHSFEKLRQVRRNFDQAKMILETLIEREERKLELIKNEVQLQRIQLKYKDEVQLVELGLAQENLSFTESSDEDDDSAYSDDMSNHGSRSGARPAMPYGAALAGFTHDPHEQVLLFTKTLLPERLAAAGIVPFNPLAANGSVHPPFNLRGRMGRGGRIIFDRWNPLLRTPYVR